MRKKIILITILNILLFSCSMKATNKLLDLIDQDISSKIVQNFLYELGSDYIIKRYENTEFEDSYHYIYKTKGIELSFDKDDKLKCIFIYSESSSNNRQYQNELPFNINFTDTRAEIENNIGLPNNKGGGGFINYYCDWDNLGISITYKSKNEYDMNNKIHHITINKIEK